MTTSWFKPRRYKHLDRQVGESFAVKVMNPAFICKHSFSPLIHYDKHVKRYKKNIGKTKSKPRAIMYASHRDACILSYYSNILSAHLNSFYENNDLHEKIIAYRPLGLGNYYFSATAFNYAIGRAPCTILAFDVSGFFDNLDHRLLKKRLKSILKVDELPDDWHKILRHVSKFHYIDLEDLKANKLFGDRLKLRSPEPIGTIAEIKSQKVKIRSNPKITAGIPQGTPISATLSNLYMIDFDIEMRDFCAGIGAMYRRYSDDILIICANTDTKAVESKVEHLILQEKLELSASKTEKTAFSTNPSISSMSKSAQYLGFTYYPGGAGIRPGSLARQWRKMRTSVKRVKKVASIAIAAGKATKAYTKSLRRRFSPLQFRNFSSYGRKSAQAFGNGEKITHQIRRFEREFEKLALELKGFPKP